MGEGRGIHRPLHEECLLCRCKFERSGAVVPRLCDALVEEERKGLSGCVFVLEAQLDGKKLSAGFLNLRELLQRSDADNSYVHEHQLDHVYRKWFSHGSIRQPLELHGYRRCSDNDRNDSQRKRALHGPHGGTICEGLRLNRSDIPVRRHLYRSRTAGDAANSAGYNIGSALSNINARGRMLKSALLAIDSDQDAP